MRVILFCFLSFIMAACTGAPKDVVLKQASFERLPGWQEDALEESLPAFEKSCARMLKNSPARQLHNDKKWGLYEDWQPACEALIAGNFTDARSYFEKYFTPLRIQGTGLFTGYYEPLLYGARTRYGPYQTPLRARPNDLVMVHLGNFREDLKGRRIAGRVVNGALKPYEDRIAISAGGLPPQKDIPIVYVDDPVDAFFLEIQGSGRIQLDTGEQIRLGYAGQNGHPYYAIGRELIERGALTKETVSLQTIRDWLTDNPDEAVEIMNTNPSYVFFTELDGDGPLGGEGLSLTPHRSLAIDRSLLAYGMPLWVDIPHPDKNKPDIEKLMIAQDTGGAIRGPVRGDYFWGFGEEAEHYAGIMKSKGGAYWVLLPHTVAQRLTQ